jgi:hypothetical protein
MFEHRFREFFEQPIPASAAALNIAFVACPCPVLAGFGPNHQAFVTEVYRIARELTEAQLRKPARTRTPAFSAN